MLEQRTTRRLQASWIVRLFVVLALLEAGSSHLYAAITDNGIHPPPTTGPYAYNTFSPGAAGFPALGGTYVDPVFGTTIRRLTDIGANRGEDDSYAHNWCNANGTYCFYTGRSKSPVSILNSTTGAVAYSGQPIGVATYEIFWHPTDPDKYFYWSGSSLRRRNLSAQTDTTMKTFPATLQTNGGSLNTVDRTGRYFTVRYGGTNKVWDSQTDTIYANAVTPLDSGGWVAITPDGNYLVTAAGGTGTPQKEHHSYAINHGTRTISTTPTQFWGLCGDHGVLVSASNGKNYLVTFNCHANAGVWRVDITLNQAGRTEAQQNADNLLLIPTRFGSTNDGHLTSVQVGPNANWIFYDSENFSNDPYNGGVLGWVAYNQEVMAANVLTGEIRRLAHHRSRGLTSSGVAYYAQPRISCSWDGSVVIWASNMNISSPTGYADIYVINNPLGASGGGDTTPPAAPVNLHIE